MNRHCRSPRALGPRLERTRGSDASGRVTERRWYACTRHGRYVATISAARHMDYRSVVCSTLDFLSVAAAKFTAEQARLVVGAKFRDLGAIANIGHGDTGGSARG